MKKIHLSLVLVSLLATQGCQTLKQEIVPAVGEAPGPAPALVLPFAEPERAAVTFDEDLMYGYLVGEIGARQGEFALAQGHYLTVARRVGDAYAAERATRLALHTKDYGAALEAVLLWVELAPNDMGARQLAALLLLRDGQQQAAGLQLDALVLIAEARGQDGFLLAAGALGGEPDRDAAEQVMRLLHERHSADVRSLYALAVLDAAHRRFEQAELNLREVIAQRPDIEQAHVLLSRVLIAQKRPQEALALLAEGVRSAPRSTLLRSSYARQLVDAADYPAALQQFRELHRLNPEDEDMTFGYAMLATQQSHWEEARPLWQGLRGSPERRDEASYYLAQIEEKAGNDDLAIGLYKTVQGAELKLDAMLRIAQILARTQRLDQGREMLRMARLAEPGRAEDLYVAEAQLTQLHGTVAETMALYDLAIGAYPENKDLVYNRALFLVEQGDFERMESELRGLLARDPDHVGSLNALGYTLADRNERLDEALSLISRALAQRPDSAAILDSMGWVLFRRGELDQAISYLQRALAMGHDDEIAAHLGEVLWVKGDRDAAREVWREGLAQSPDSDKLREVLERLQVGDP